MSFVPQYREPWSFRPGPNEFLNDVERYNAFPGRPYPSKFTQRQTTDDLVDGICRLKFNADEEDETLSEYGYLASLSNDEIYGEPPDVSRYSGRDELTARSYVRCQRFAGELRWKLKIIKMKRSSILNMTVRPCSQSEMTPLISCMIEVSERFGNLPSARCPGCGVTWVLNEVCGELFFPRHVFCGLGDVPLSDNDIATLQIIQGEFKAGGGRPKVCPPNTGITGDDYLVKLYALKEILSAELLHESSLDSLGSP